MMINIERVGNTSDRLGEGPLWSPTEGALYWVDGSDGEIWRWEAATNSNRCWIVRGRIGSIALRRNGGALVAVETGLQFFDFTTSARSPVALDQPPMSGRRPVRNPRTGRQG
ncbi:MAG TPA: SMP-30/gluconolactonase/LRE family protein [Candidatus Binataceae bacterium]|jgi:L-arabinonolactonase|nr:SMP-30/gluconolactonase/LRE family protein [Candidatus Binataceae bacterium]